MKNPLNKRIPRELVRDLGKYLVILLFMVIMIGVVSGVYVGHDSMMASLKNGNDEFNLEDGNFELNKQASNELLADLSSGKRADLRQHFLDEAYREADEAAESAARDALEKSVQAAIEETVREQCKAYGVTDEDAVSAQIEAAIQDQYADALKTASESEDYQTALHDARLAARKEAEQAVDETWEALAEEYSLNEECEDCPVTVYAHFYKNEDEDLSGDGTADATIRVFRSDSPVDRASFLSGRAPEAEGEIAIDRMHADNVGLRIGDSLKVGRKTFRIVGLLSYVNYITLHEKNNALMFDAFGFDVGMVTPADFEVLGARTHYSYAYFYETKPANDYEKADRANDFLKILLTQTVKADAQIEDYVPVYLNQAVNFAPDDIESDTAGTEILVYILIAVIAFIFAVTIDSTIEKEAPVIGTLRASGFTKGELIRHYMTVPVIITLLGAALGNLLGYTVFKDVAVDLYYNSYSMPKYQTVWSPAALVKTTIIPLVLMFCINLTVIVFRLRLSPLRFLRRDLKRTKRAKARRLPRWSFLRRFRIRILLQNIPNYLILTFGVVFIEIMLCFAFGFPDSLDHYAQNAPDMLFAKYQYLLTDTEDEDGTEITVDSPEAERFSAAALLLKNGTHDESVTVYGYETGSRYVQIREALTGTEVFVSRAMSQKYGLQAGDTVRLSEKYKHKDYEFRVKGVFDYDGGVALFLPNESFNQLFDKEAGSFNGYFSNTGLADLPESKIASVMTARDITKITDQLDHSIGGFMGIFQYALLALSVILLYLLSKIIIEKNEHAISMVKILGFRTGEIASLYILTTAIMVLLSALIGFAAGYTVIQVLFRIFMMRMDGWFTFYLSPTGGVLSILFVILGYALVALIDFHRIKRIPLNEALKNVE